jgi:hypothetical protein
MWVEPEMLSSGGDVARSAGERVLGGAAALSAAPIGSSIFGDFAAARSFHQRLSQHRIGQVTKMRDNHRTLTGVGEKAKTSSGWFTETETRNKSAVGASLAPRRWRRDLVAMAILVPRPVPPPAQGQDTGRS